MTTYQLTSNETLVYDTHIIGNKNFATIIHLIYTDNPEGPITIPKDINGAIVKYIRKRAFSHSRTRSISLPDTISSIGSRAFAYCEDLKRVSLPKELLILGDEAFANCQNLFSVILPASLRYLGKNSFKNCSPDFTAICYENTTAVKLCEKAGIKYEVISYKSDMIRFLENVNTRP